MSPLGAKQTHESERFEDVSRDSFLYLDAPCNQHDHDKAYISLYSMKTGKHTNNGCLRVPLTRTSGSRPTAGKSGPRNQKFHTETVLPNETRSCCFPSQKFVSFNFRREKITFSKVGPTSQKLRFRLLRTLVFASENLCFATFPSITSLFRLGTFLSMSLRNCFLTKHVKVTAFSCRATLRAVRSDRPDRVLEDCQCWSWTI